MIDTTYSTTPPIAGVVGMSGTAAPWAGTAVPTAVRLRVPMTGLPVGDDHCAEKFQLNSDTPGDLPPRDPLS